MNSIFWLAVVCVGQMVAGSTTYVDYLYGTMVVEEKHEAVVKYDDGRYWKVIVVNGFAPEITINYLCSGGTHYVLDYRGHIPYKLSKPVAETPMLAPKPTPKPTLAESKPIERPKSSSGMMQPSEISDPSNIVSPQYNRLAEE